MAGGARTSAERPPPGRRRSGTQKTACAPSKVESTLTTPRRHRLTTCAQRTRSVKRFARENGACESLTGAQAHSWGWFQGCRTSFGAAKNREAPSPCAEREEQHLCTARGPHGQEVRAARRRRARCRDVCSSAASGTRLEKRMGEVWSMGGQKRRCAKESHCHEPRKALKSRTTRGAQNPRRVVS